MTTLADAIATPAGININGTIGRQAAAASKSVALATDDSAALAAIGTKLNASIAVTGTFWQATQPVSGTVGISGTVPVSGTFWQATQPVSLASLPALAAGANIIGAVTQSGTWSITGISGTISLPTGAATAANQGTLNTNVGAIADAAAANGASGTALSYLRSIKDAATDTTTPSPVRIDQTTPGTTDAVTIKQPCDVISFVPVLDTAAYAAGDVLSATAAIANITRVNDGRCLLQSLTGIDKSKQKPAMTILFYQTNVTSAAANAANAMSDTDQLTLIGFKRILAADWIDYANNSICCFAGPTAPGLLLEAASGTRDIYAVTILDAGTPTFAVGDLMFKLGVVQS